MKKVKSSNKLLHEEVALGAAGVTPSVAPSPQPIDAAIPACPPACVRASACLHGPAPKTNHPPAACLPARHQRRHSVELISLASFINDSAAHSHILLITLSCAASCLKKRRETHTYIYVTTNPPTHPPFHPSQTPILGLHTTWVSGPPATLCMLSPFINHSSRSERHELVAKETQDLCRRGGVAVS